MTAPLTMKQRIYVEDVDSLGIVYHANYLNFFERARTEFMRKNGFDLWNYTKETETFFVVRQCNLDFKKSAFLDDEVTIQTCLVSGAGARLRFHQHLEKDGDLLVSLEILLAHISKEGNPLRLPNKVIGLLSDSRSESVSSLHSNTNIRKMML